MKNWSRLILPLGLGIVAMAINAAAMRNRLTPVHLVAINRNVVAGEKLTATDLSPVAVSYPNSHLTTHFFTWQERDALLMAIGTPTRLTAGDLIPKQAFRSYGRNSFSLPEKHLLIGIRCPETVISPADHRLLLPGRDATIRFRGGTRAYGPYVVAFLQPSDVEAEDPASGNAYELGLLVPQQDSDVVDLFSSGDVNSVTGSPD